MLPPRQKRNSAKVNLIISTVFHSVLIAALFFFAAREGMLGKKLKTIAVTMAPKEKPAEKPKEPETKAEPPKLEEIQKLAEAVAAPPPVTPTATAPPAMAPAVAPPAAYVPSFDVPGGKIVETSSDPVLLYKGFVEYLLRSRWTRPEGIQDDNYVAEIELAIDATGKVASSNWQRGSGDARWDESVKKALAQTPSIGRPPPKKFPDRFVVRFDVEASGTEPLLQAAISH